MTSSARDNGTRLPKLFSAALFVAGIVAISLLIGFVTSPGEWYQSLAKPAFNPPAWLFGPVWIALYVLIAISGWRIWRTAPRSAAMMLWIAQMALNWIWSPAFFGAEAPWLAFVIIVAMLATLFMFIVQAWKHDRLSAWLFVPYAAWVAFATVLNGSIAAMN